jgi:hypothetical protein
MAGNAIYKTRKPVGNWGYMAKPIANPNLLGKELKVTRYGEQIELRYNPANDSHIQYGHDVAEATDGHRTVFIGHEFASGQPPRWDVSWAKTSDLPKVRWLTGRTPILKETETGIVQEGPLTGLQLVLVGCSQ